MHTNSFDGCAHIRWGTVSVIEEEKKKFHKVWKLQRKQRNAFILSAFIFFFFITESLRKFLLMKKLDSKVKVAPVSLTQRLLDPIQRLNIQRKTKNICKHPEISSI